MHGPLKRALFRGCNIIILDNIEQIMCEITLRVKFFRFRLVKQGPFKFFVGIIWVIAFSAAQLPGLHRPTTSRIRTIKVRSLVYLPSGDPTAHVFGS